MPTWNYTAPDFYGFGGERPFYPAFQRHDYSGHRALECLPLDVTTQADAPGHLGFGWLRLVSTYSGEGGSGSGVGDDVHVPQRAALQIALPAETLAKTGPVTVAIWRDNANVTFSTAIDGAVSLPLPRTLRQTATGAACVYNCWSAFSVKVATRSGAHGLANVRVTASSSQTGYAVIADMFSYVVGEVRRTTENLVAGPPPAAALRGASVFGAREGATRVALGALQASKVVTGAEVPGGIGAQWTLSTKVLVRILTVSRDQQSGFFSKRSAMLLTESYSVCWYRLMQFRANRGGPVHGVRAPFTFLLCILLCAGRR